MLFPTLIRWATTAVTVCIFLASQHPLLAGDVKIWSAPGASLANIKTFRMLPPRVLTKSGLVEEDPIYAPLISAAVRRELAMRGLTEVAEGEDIQVSAGAFASATPQIEAMVVYWFGVGSPGVTLGRYNHAGTVAVNLIDPKTKSSVWAGLSSESLGKTSALESDINKATKALFKKYPKK
jgi:hypothetical protein